MRGFVFMLEAAFASLLLVGFMISMGGMRFAETPEVGPDLGNVLDELAAQGTLNDLAYSGNVSGIESMISLPGYSHSVRLCRPSGCTGSAPGAGEVWVSSYLLAGGDSPDPMEVKLYAWKA
jgi:hypothetical protein